MGNKESTALLEVVASPRGEAFASQLEVQHDRLVKAARRILGKKEAVRVACHMLLHGSHGHASRTSLEAQRGVLSLLAAEDLGADDILVVMFFLSLSTACRCIDLSHNPGVDDAGVRALCAAMDHAPRVERLLLDGCAVGDDGCARLGELLCRGRTIDTLSLNGNRFSTKGIRSLVIGLKESGRVDTLRVESNKVDAIGASAFAAALAERCSLTQLVLSKNPIGNAGAAALARGLRANPPLEQLHLSEADIGDPGAVALADALRVNTVLTDLVMWHNPIADEGTAAFAAALEVNTTVKGLRGLQLPAHAEQRIAANKAGNRGVAEGASAGASGSSGIVMIKAGEGLSGENQLGGTAPTRSTSI